MHYHARAVCALADVLTAVRLGVSVSEAGDRLFPNAERVMKSPEEMAAGFAAAPGAFTRTLEIAHRATFSLAELRYEYPEELTPRSETPLEYLARMAWAVPQALSREHSRQSPRTADARVDADPGIALRGVLSHRFRHGPFCSAAGHFVPRPGLGGQLGRLLLPGRHGRGSSARGFAVRAVREPRTERAPDIDIDFEHERARRSAAISLR